MTENQKTKMALLFMSAGDLKNAEQAYKFIMADGEKQENMPGIEAPDGIYLIKKDSSPVLFEPREPYEKGCGLKGYVAVGIKMGGKSIAVALKDAAGGDDITLTDKKDETGWDGYKGNRTDAVSDWDGKENTAHLEKIGLNEEIVLEAGQYIPSVGEMYLIYLYKKALNEALKYIGGEPLADDWYWTSTEYSATDAWSLNLNSGRMNGSTKATGTLHIRPVSAFNIK